MRKRHVEAEVIAVAGEVRKTHHFEGGRIGVEVDRHLARKVLDVGQDVVGTDGDAPGFGQAEGHVRVDHEGDEVRTAGREGDRPGAPFGDQAEGIGHPEAEGDIRVDLAGVVEVRRGFDAAFGLEFRRCAQAETDVARSQGGVATRGDEVGAGLELTAFLHPHQRGGVVPVGRGVVGLGHEGTGEAGGFTTLLVDAEAGGEHTRGARGQDEGTEQDALFQVLIHFRFLSRRTADHRAAEEDRRVLLTVRTGRRQEPDVPVCGNASAPLLCTCSGYSAWESGDWGRCCG